jgi:hypothetical protein
MNIKITDFWDVTCGSVYRNLVPTSSGQKKQVRTIFKKEAVRSSRTSELV